MINLRQLISDLTDDHNEKLARLANQFLSDAEIKISDKIRADINREQWSFAVYENKDDLTPAFLKEVYDCLVENFSNKTQLTFEYKQNQTAPLGAGAFTPGKYFINFYITKVHND